MALSEALSAHTLGPDDAAQGLALSDAAGWNQTADDWRLFARHGRVFALRDGDAGPLVATAAALPYGGGIGWISMVLVTPAWQHQGLASALMQRCIAQLRSLKATPVLDATPAGAAAYARLGFQPGFALARWQGRGTAAVQVPVAAAADPVRIGALDRAAIGFDRALLFNDFLSRPGTRAWFAPDGDGFVLAREGRRATQLGPLVARDEATALALLQDALAALHGPVFLDLPERWSALAQSLQAQGFTRQRGFVRMALGAAPIATTPERLFVLAGPEFA